MTRQITIKLTGEDNNVSKQAEINVLDDLFAFFKDRNLYLSSFFRPDLIDWATQAISNDLSPDIWADRNYRSSIADERASQLRNAEIAINELEDEIKTGYENTESAFIERDERIQGLEDQLEISNSFVQQYKDETHTLRTELMMERTKVIELTDQMRLLEQDTLIAKAQAYDLMMVAGIG